MRSVTLALTCLVAVLAAGPSCTLSRLSTTECKSNTDCLGTFGRGMICVSEGRCEKAPAFPRCQDTFPPDVLQRPEAYPGIVLFGTLTNRTNAAHVPRENAIQLALDQANELTGDSGTKFGLIKCDIAGKQPKYDALEEEEAAIASAHYLHDVMGIPAVFGPFGSAVLLSVYTEMKGSGLLLFSPSATADSLTALDNAKPTDDQPGLIWRTAQPDQRQAAIMANFFNSRNPRVTKVTVVAKKDAYGTGLTEAFTKVFGAGGGTVSALTFANQPEATAAADTAGKDSNEWVVVIGQSDDDAQFVKAAATFAGFDSKKLFFTDTAGNSTFLDKIRSEAKFFPRMFGTRPNNGSGKAYDLMRASFNQTFGLDTNNLSLTYLSHAYDAAWLMLYGTAWSLGVEKNVSGIGIARGLRRVASTGTESSVIPTNWIVLRDKFAANKKSNLLGASSSLNFDPKTGQLTHPMDVWGVQIDGSSIVIQETFQ